MPLWEVAVECPVHESFRARQVAGMFDVPWTGTAGETFRGEIPGLDEPWEIGLIVGPSGSGKTTLARRAFGDAVYAPGAWPADRAVVDGFGELPIKTITGLLTAVGLSSPPSWLKPYAVLSNGEKFRCDLARALSPRDDSTAVVYDEFTSVVDRQIARIGSAAVARAVRGGKIARRFVAVTCHYDVAEWLEPDWALDLADGQLRRGRLRRPPIELRVFRARRTAWRLFARHHYLNGGLNPAARCYVATWRDAPVAFAATLPLFGHRGRRRISRVVVLPDYQGIGLGMEFVEAVAALEAEQGHRLSITAAHPAVIAHAGRSPRWRASRAHTTRGADGRGPSRAVVSFAFLPDNDSSPTPTITP